jgi:diacylglycerol kinase (ATP)
MTAKVILNPYSNRWKAKERWPEAEAALINAGIKFELAVSEHPRHVIELAEIATRKGFSPIIAAGGDGTIGETINGMAKAMKSEGDPLGPLGVIPLGSANDLVDNLKLPRDLRDAARIIAAGKTRKMDIGSVNGLYFDNNSAMGLEPYVTLIQQRISLIKGMARYLVAAVIGVMNKPVWKGTIEWDDGKYEGPILLVTVGNGPRTGGFFMTPHANLFDGKLTFAYGFTSSRLKAFSLLPKALKPGAGSYVEEPEIHEQEATWIRIHVDNPTPAHVDGEIFSHEIHDLEYHIHPGRLQILCGG